MNDEERRQWVQNDEGLYCWQQSEESNLYKFVRKHRKEIDAVIENVTTGKKPAHYLCYGG